MSISIGSTILASDFIDEGDKDATPANDNGRGIKLENTGDGDAKVSRAFLPQLKSQEVFTSSGSFTVPDGITEIKIRAWGAGGGGSGGSTSTTSSRNCGAGGGGYGEGIYDVTPADVITVTIGAGGTYSNPGGHGGTSSAVRSTNVDVTCTGGDGGVNDGGLSTVYAGGVGAVTGSDLVTDTDYALSGQDGVITSNSNSASPAGIAAGSIGGNGGPRGGHSGFNGGATAGSAGDDGLVIIEW